MDIILGNARTTFARVFIILMMMSAASYAADQAIRQHLGSLYNIQEAPHGFVISFPTVFNESAQRLMQKAHVLAPWYEDLENNIMHIHDELWQHHDLWLEALKKIVVNRRETKAEKMKYVVDSRAAHEIFINLTHKHPLMCCSECGMARRCMSDCPLARSRDISKCARAALLAKILEVSPNGPQHGCIFFGPGGSLFEVQVIAKFLKHQAPFEHIYFIEPDWKLSYDIMVLVDSVLGQGQKNDEFAVAVDRLRHVYRLIQVTHFLWAQNPKLKFHVYATHQDYRADLAENGKLRADALIAMDPIEVQIIHSNAFAPTSDQIKKELLSLEGSLCPHALVAENYRDASSKVTSIVKQIEPVCAQCNKAMPVANYCGKCLSVTYCSRECQITHWRSGHNANCLPIVQ